MFFDNPEEAQEFAEALSVVTLTVDRIDDIEITDDTARAKVSGTVVELVSGDRVETEISETELLRKEDGVWKLCNTG